MSDEPKKELIFFFLFNVDNTPSAQGRLLKLCVVVLEYGYTWGMDLIILNYFNKNLLPANTWIK